MQEETEKKMNSKRITSTSTMMAFLYFVPILSLVTIIPAFMFAERLEKIGISTTCIICAIIAIMTIIHSLTKVNELYESKANTIAAELILGSNVNYIAAANKLGENGFSHGDAQSILVVIFSGPIAAVSIILFLIAVIICYRLRN